MIQLRKLSERATDIRVPHVVSSAWDAAVVQPKHVVKAAVCPLVDEERRGVSNDRINLLRSVEGVVELLSSHGRDKPGRHRHLLSRQRANYGAGCRPKR